MSGNIGKAIATAAVCAAAGVAEYLHADGMGWAVLAIFFIWAA